ncbi:nuclear transport factor 2 family protein [Streptomyces sp. NPDC088261]|uniref:nuclear transport factor 2 family protein n=1 Tax=Streptomyces sp. NPDC088261 TaxID=3365851 RepID=UPI00380AE83C
MTNVDELSDRYAPDAATSLIHTFIEALNTGDLDRLSRCFAEGAIVNDAGREIRGREAIGAWAEREFVGQGGRITPTRMHPVSELGGDVVVEAELTGARRRGPSTLVVTLTEGAIALLRLRA